MSTITKAFEFQSSDQKNLLYGYIWKPAYGKIKGCVQIIHDLGEHSLRYHEFATYLCSQGYAVYAFDLLGHGRSAKSEEKLGYFARNDGHKIIIADLQGFTKLIKKESPGHPIYLFGDGFGSLCARRLMVLNPRDYAGIILAGTWGTVHAASLNLRIAKKAAKKHGVHGRSDYLDNLSFVPYNNQFKPVRTEFDWVSSDEAEVDAFLEDPLCAFRYSCSLYVDFYTLLTKVSNKLWYRRVPVNTQVLILSGMDDPIGNFGKGVRQFYNDLRNSNHPKVKCKTYYHARHKVLHDTCKEEVYSDVAEWLGSTVTL